MALDATSDAAGGGRTADSVEQGGSAPSRHSVPRPATAGPATAGAATAALGGPLAARAEAGPTEADRTQAIRAEVESGTFDRAAGGRIGRYAALFGWRTALTLAMLAGWEIAAHTLISPFWISQPTRVFARIWDLTVSGLLFWHVGATLEASLLGLVAGVIAGVAGGLLLGARPGIAAVFDPLLMGLNSLPRVALAPLFIIWFGIGLPSKVVLAFSLVVFPILINTYQGVRNVDRDLIDVLRTMQATPAQIVRRVTIPSTLPWIFAGLRIGLGMSLIGAVVGELVGSNRGVGYYIEERSANFDTTGVFAGLVVLMVMTIALNELTKLVEGRLFRWKPADTR